MEKLGSSGSTISNRLTVAGCFSVMLCRSLAGCFMTSLRLLVVVCSSGKKAKQTSRGREGKIERENEKTVDNARESEPVAIIRSQ